MVDVRASRNPTAGEISLHPVNASPAIPSDRLKSLRQAAFDSSYISLGGRRTESVHEFYRYPARFSPSIARAAIEAFSDPGDVVIDPFCGGGTTAVEAQRLKRLAIAADINPLATFITTAKTTAYSQEALDELLEFSGSIGRIKLRGSSRSHERWADLGYWRNISDPVTWRIRDLLQRILLDLSALNNPHAEQLARCALLRTGQWALDMRDTIPSVEEFRQQLDQDIRSMVEVADAHRQHVENAWGQIYEPVVIEKGLPDSVRHPLMKVYGPPRLILMSPPYPGVYVNYHRWKVRGRRETPAPYWIADRLDGHGISRYTMSARNRDGSKLYYTKLSAALEALISLLDGNSTVVQVVGFNGGYQQLDRYLWLMNDLGLTEVILENLSTASDGRLWRDIPGRRWWVAAGQRSEAAPSTSREVVLIHRKP